MALLAGWLAFRAPVTGPDGDGAATKGLALKSADRRAEAEEGRRLLEEMREGWGTVITVSPQARPSGVPERPSIETMKEEMRQKQAEELAEIRKRSLAVVLPADPAAELARLVAGPEGRDSAAFVIAWLRADPVAALRYLEGDAVLIRNSGMTRALEIWVAEAGAEKVASLLEEAPGWQTKLAGALMKVAASADPGQLDGLLEQMEGTINREQLIEAAFRELPAAGRSAALEWIVGSLKGKEAGRAVMMIALGINDQAAAKAFLKEAMTDLDAEGVAHLKGWGNYGDIMRSGVGPDSPMEERVDAMLAGGVVGKTDEERRKNARASIVSQDLSRWLASQGMGEALKAGEMEVADLWQEASREFPRFDEEEGMLRAVFEAGARHDPAGAVKLLIDQGQGEQAGVYVLRSFTSMVATDVEKAMELTAQLPQETMRENLSAFDRVYSYNVIRHADQGGTFWTDWVGQQAPGLSKDLMLHYTARHYFQTGNEALGTELKGRVQDPTVKSWPKL